MSNLEGAVLSDYLLVQCISKGGVADVYRAQQQSEGRREVAIKVFRPSYAERASFRDYFMLEAEKIGQFDHPNILPFLEYGEGEELLYVVTPLMTTGTLDDLLVRVGGRLPALQVLPIVQQLCSAIHYAHLHNVVHGNIKPADVFVAADGRMLLADFGIARGYDDSQQSLTRVGWGSAEYAAPEQSLGILNPSSDIYTLGVLLFRLLTGTLPFTGQTPIEVLLKHVRQSPPSARELVPTISENVERVLRTALQKRSEDRFASAEELGDAFLAAVTVAPVASPLSRPLGVPTPLFASSSTATNARTPLPALNAQGVVNDPATPLPPSIASSSALHSTPALEATSSSITMDGAGDSDVTEIRRKNFLEEDDEKDLGQLWQADPQEWSPLADPLSEAGLSEAPFTADEYLRSKPLISELSPSPSPPPESGSEQKSTRKGINRWLPVIVVVLLLLGLLISLLSALLFPTEKTQNIRGYIPETVAVKHLVISVKVGSGSLLFLT
ncbi:MAG: serine/threonine protein kinase [Ktedonobacteraceae bacterium]|nr:serine/threonine protein kinase [Ktedonobacteraceae bacterium]